MSSQEVISSEESAVKLLPLYQKLVDIAVRETTQGAEVDNSLVIEPIQPNYAELSTEEAFDWQSIVKQARTSRDLGDDPFYLVVFRSVLKPDADKELLHQHDVNAHIAALASPALIHYFAGDVDSNGRGLSFCLWSNPDAAKSISRDPQHVAAAKMVSQYKSYSIERHDVHHDEDIVKLIPHMP